MSPHFPVMSGALMMCALQMAGFEQASQRGSYVKVRHTDGRVAIVRNHKELAQRTLRSVLRQAGILSDDFRRLIDQ